MDRWAKRHCKTIVSVPDVKRLHTDNRTHRRKNYQETCTSCASGRFFVVKFHKSMAGSCKNYKKRPGLHCTTMNANVRWPAVTGGQFCSKWGKTDQWLRLSSMPRKYHNFLRKNRPWYKSTILKSYCRAGKHTACSNSGHCRSKKYVSCLCIRGLEKRANGKRRFGKCYKHLCKGFKGRVGSLLCRSSAAMF